MLEISNMSKLSDLEQEKVAFGGGLIWHKVRSQLRKLFGEAAYQSWLKSINFVGQSSGEIVLSAPTRFIKDWISVHYLDKITTLWREEDQYICSVQLIVLSGQPTHYMEQEDSDTQNSNIYNLESPEDRGEDNSIQTNSYDHLSSPLDPRFTFDNFVVGKPNELAFAAAKRVAESNQPISGSNPLFLYGGVGLGKTHLMHAIAWHIIKGKTKRKVAYLSAEKFMYQYITALRSKDIMMFKEQFRSVDVLMVDDVQFISGKDSTQEEFFHTFNALIDQNKQLVISADRSPSDLDGVEERIKSRLGWGLVADINDTTFELRLGILQSKVETMGISIADNVLEFLAKNIKSNIRELEGALNKVVAHSALVGRSITIDSASDTLSDLLRSNHKAVGIDEIQKKVSDYFSIKISDMHSTRRVRNLARARQIAMYLSKRLTQKSLPDIGRAFGGRDHATVIHAVKQIEKFMESDAMLCSDVQSLLKSLM